MSDEAASLYDSLVRDGGGPIGDGPGQVSLTGGIGNELYEAGALNVTGHGSNLRVQAVPPDLAARRLLHRRHRELVRLQELLETAWSRLTTLPWAPGLPDGGTCGCDLRVADDVRVIIGHAEVARLASGLYRAPNRLLRATLNGRFAGGTAPHATLLPPPDALAAGAEFRMIYDASHLADQWGAQSVERSIAAGEQARVRDHVHVKMMHVDDEQALVTIDATGASGGLLIRSPALLGVLAEWFDHLWDDPGTATVAGPRRADLTPVQYRILQLLAVGLTDDAIAATTGCAVRTVRRHVAAITTTLNAESRFAAGVAAARLGWV